MFQISRHPWLVLGTGIAVGYLIYRYRDELLDKARSAAEQTDEIMRGPRERLRDLYAADEAAGSAASQ